MDQTFIFNDATSTRLDKYLTEQIGGLSRRFFQQQIKKGGILVNNKQVQPDYQLKTGDVVKVSIEKKKADDPLVPQPEVPFTVVFQNNDFLIIDKPAGLTVHPSATQKKDTLVNGLLHKFPQVAGVGEDPLRPGIVHRLDKDTSGLMVVCLNQKSFLYFKNLFQNHQVEKKYNALVWGNLKNKQDCLQSYIGRSKANPLKQASAVNPEKVSNPKKAITCYRVITEYPETSMVELTPKTGRKHQIRIHMHSIGHSLVGDPKYYTKLVKEKNKQYDRHFLHAVSLKFEFPDGTPFEFNSPLPKTFLLPRN